jgi:hypothetical protein
MSQQQPSQQGMTLAQASQLQVPERCADIPWIAVACLCRALEVIATKNASRVTFFEQFRKSYVNPSAKDQMLLYRILCAEVSTPAGSMLRPCEGHALLCPCLHAPPPSSSCMHMPACLHPSPTRIHTSCVTHTPQLDLKRTYYMKEAALAKRLCDAIGLSSASPVYNEVVVSALPPSAFLPTFFLPCPPDPRSHASSP